MLKPLNEIKLRILVFGPNPGVANPPGFTAVLAKKRLEIKDALIRDGHEAVFPEDLWKGPVDPDLDNTYIWEQMLVLEYDMVVSLVGSFGAVSELSLFHKDSLALKACLFFSNDHTGGLPYQQAKAIEKIGAKENVYTYPVDLTSCNLMKQVRDKVKAVRIGKFFNS